MQVVSPLILFTQWASYTPVITGWGTPSGVSFLYRREDIHLLVKGIFTSGTPTAVVGKVGFPSGLTLDTDACLAAQSEKLGEIYLANGTVSTTPITSRGPWALVYESGVNGSLSFARDVDTDTTFWTLATPNGLWNSGHAALVTIKVPILEWR